MNDNDKTLLGLGWLFILLAVIALILIKLLKLNLSFFMLPCIFRHITGLYCPGCGSTRALICLINHNLYGALYFNVGFVFGLFFFFLYIFCNTFSLLTKNKLNIGIKFKNIYIYIWVFLLLANCIIKNILLVFL